MHVYFTEPLTAEHVAATGYFDSLTPKPTTAEQDAGIRSLFQAFGIESLADRPFARLSVGEQRLVLLVRALVKRPPLLILDEPFQGLDQVTMNRVRDWLDANIRPDQTLLFVTHHSEEIPRCVTKTLRLREGRVE
jgi:molybdate transport system ATP-binding protein